MKSPYRDKRLFDTPRRHWEQYLRCSGGKPVEVVGEYQRIVQRNQDDNAPSTINCRRKPTLPSQKNDTDVKRHKHHGHFLTSSPLDSSYNK